MQALDCGMWDMTWAPCIGSMSIGTGPQGSPSFCCFNMLPEHFKLRMWISCVPYIVTLLDSAAHDIRSPFVLLIHSLFVPGKSQLSSSWVLLPKGRCQSFSAPTGSTFDSEQVSKLVVCLGSGGNSSWGAFR